jgi:hypothetical protein
MRRYHHIGIPTTEAKPGETHLKRLKLFVVGHEKSEFGVEWMRFEADAAVPDLVRQVPHVAFEVPSSKPFPTPPPSQPDSSLVGKPEDSSEINPHTVACSPRCLGASLAGMVLAIAKSD